MAFSPSEAHHDELVGKAFDRRLFARLLAFARPHTRGFLLSMVLLGVTTLTLAVPVIVGRVVDQYLDPGDAAGGHAESSRGLWSAALLLAGIGVVVFTARIVQLRVINTTGQKVIHDLRTAVFSHITRRDLRFFDRHPVGALVTRVNGDIETLNEFFVSGLDVLLYDLLRVLIIVVILLLIHLPLALVTLTVMPLVAGWSFFFQRRARILFRRVRGQVSRLNAYMNEAITGVPVIKAFCREKAVTDRFQEVNSDLKQAHVDTVRNFSWFFPGMELISTLGLTLILVVGGDLVLGGELETGVLVTFWLFLNLLIEPLRQLADRYNVLQAAVAAGERVFRILDDRSALPVPEKPGTLGATRGEVVFEDLDFSYDGRKRVLQDVSFRVGPGEHLALVGPTGAGKSTIINLLCRFYDPVAGRILLDGRDLRELDPFELRRRVGVVLQDIFLFAGTVRENLDLGDKELDDSHLMQAAEAVQAHRIIERLGGLDAPVTERGSTLSMGERQLLAFARTLAHNPAVLVLDEATAHVDTLSEVLIQRALDRLLAGRTAILIAHRLSTIQKCDRIIVLHHGRIREQGDHRSLLALDGIYARLHRMQFMPEDRAEDAGAPRRAGHPAD